MNELERYKYVQKKVSLYYYDISEISFLAPIRSKTLRARQIRGLKPVASQWQTEIRKGIPLKRTCCFQSANGNGAQQRSHVSFRTTAGPRLKPKHTHTHTHTDRRKEKCRSDERRRTNKVEEHKTLRDGKPRKRERIRVKRNSLERECAPIQISTDRFIRRTAQSFHAAVSPRYF